MAPVQLRRYPGEIDPSRQIRHASGIRPARDPDFVRRGAPTTAADPRPLIPLAAARRVRHGDLNRVASIESRSDDTSPSVPTTRRESTPSHGGIEVPDPERRLQELLNTKFTRHADTHSGTAAPLHRRVTGQTALTGMEHDTPVLNAVNARDDGRVNDAERINGRREIVTDEQSDRRGRQPSRRAVPRTVRERGQPAGTARVNSSATS